MKTTLLFLLAFCCLPFALHSQTAVSCFDHFKKDGEAAFVRKRFDLARKKFAAAKECPDVTGEQRRQMDVREQRNLNALQVEIERAEASEQVAIRAAERADTARQLADKALKTTEAALETARKLRLESEAATRHSMANDLAFKAQSSLRDGDRTTALRLVEFAWKFVEPGNRRVRQALLEIFYQNDNLISKRPMPWCLARFEIPDGYGADQIEFSKDGRFLMATSILTGIHLFEIATGLEIFHKKDIPNFEKATLAPDGSAIAMLEFEQPIFLLNPLKPDEKPLELPNSKHLNNVHLAFSDDGKKLMAAWMDGTFMTWDVRTGKASSVFAGADRPTWGAQVSSDGKWLLLPGFDGSVRMLDAATGEQKNTMPLDNPYLLTVAYSNDYQEVAFATVDSRIEIWNLPKAQKRLVMNLEKPATGLIFSLDDQTLTVVFSDNSAKNFNLQDGRETPLDMASNDEIYGQTAQSSSGKRQLIERSFEQYVDIVNRETGSVERLPVPYNQYLSLLGFTPDERFAYLTFQNGAAEVYDAETGRLICDLPPAGQITALAFSADNRRFAIARNGGELEVWPLEFEGQLFPKDTVVHSSVSFAPTSETFSVGYQYDGGDSIAVFEATTGSRLFSVKNRGFNNFFTPDGQKVISFKITDAPISPPPPLTTNKQPTGQGGTFYITDAESGEVVRRFDFPKLTYSTNLIFSADSRLMAVYQDFTTTIFDIETGLERPEYAGAQWVEFSADNRWAAQLVDSQHVVRVIGRHSGQVFFEHIDRGGSFSNLRFSPDGQMLFFRQFNTDNSDADYFFPLQPGAELEVRPNSNWDEDHVNVEWSRDGDRLFQAGSTFKSVDAKTGKMVAARRFENASYPVISPDGLRMASVSKQNELMILDARTGRELFPLRGHTEAVASFRFSPDGQWILTVSEDKTARIWDSKAGRQQFVLRADTLPMTNGFFSDDGKKVVIFQDGRAKVWHLDAELMFAELNRGSQKAVLTARQLYDFGLEDAFRSEADFEKILKDWPPAQSLEAAQFFLQQARLSSEPTRFETQFRQAERFFQQVLKRRDRGNLNLQLQNLYGEWMAKNLLNGLFDGARKHAAQFNELRNLSEETEPKFQLFAVQADWLTGKKEESQRLSRSLMNYMQVDFQELQQAVDLLVLADGGSEEVLKFRQILDAHTILGEPMYLEREAEFVEPVFADLAEKHAWQIRDARTKLGQNLAFQTAYGQSDGLVTELGNLGYFLLFDKKWAESAQLSQYAMNFDSSATWAWSNLAHAFLFDGEAEKAASIYKKWKAEPYPKDAPEDPQQTFGEVFLQDFNLFADEGLTHRDLPAMVELVGGQKLSKEERARYTGKK